MRKLIPLTLCGALVAGCSTIGSVNGVPVNQPVSVSTQNAQTFCQTNPAICILGGALAVGAVGYLINQGNDDGDQLRDA